MEHLGWVKGEGQEEELPQQIVQGVFSEECPLVSCS